MKQVRQVKVVASASTGSRAREARIEKLLAGESGQVILRLTVLAEGKPISPPLVIAEDELIDLLHKAIHAEVVSLDFVGKLHEEIEI
jgi:hypothetical protein